ncbi:DUF3606 domain-containing protein [Mucilaginibacter calamicampi]|uniref:DUF3606 domain-containing protein n=1 Tax=Mucilaginibacter calamicampi TaxID=1302352 RepID=A0ABW2YU86_9SPHI
MDNTAKTGTPDSKTINLNEDYEIKYWTKELNASKEELTDAVNEVGKSAEAVREYLNTRDLNAKYPPLT